jgi:predicted ATP-dependent endonuclease of OLD family
MKIFSGISVNYYKNIKHADLNGLGDLNIVIGPNNCGKTNLLAFIQSLGTLQPGSGVDYLCPECKETGKRDSEICSLSLNLGLDDYYRKEREQTETKVSFLLEEEQINILVPRILEKQKKKLETNSCRQIDNSIIMERPHNAWSCIAKHFSIFIHRDIIEEIKRNILYCPEQRLQSYKEKDFRDYIQEKKLRSSQKKKWIDFLNKIVDAKIDDEKYERLIRKLNGIDFETSLSEQGSGVRSLACLAVDILFSDAKIVLIDEPELGLNPFVKQEFLNFLLEESRDRQIFIATQDPTFVNPILWRDKDRRVSVYIFSPTEEKFVKIDLNQNQEDPNTFAGYLPHTTSLNDIHLYVEGSSDVYIFQIFLEKHLKKNWTENWFEILNKVGIYHLNGDNWRHLLYTIPKSPYKCAVVLDGDKKNDAEKVCGEYNKLAINASKFKFCKTIEDVKNNFWNNSHPVYCLNEDCIEKYFVQDFNCANPPQDYNKKRDGPKKAEELKDVPEEITKLFEVILKGINTSWTKLTL